MSKSHTEWRSLVAAFQSCIKFILLLMKTLTREGSLVSKPDIDKTGLLKRNIKNIHVTVPTVFKFKATFLNVLSAYHSH